MSPPDPIPLSALHYWLYWPRECALIRNEQVWAENRFTAGFGILGQMRMALT